MFFPSLCSKQPPNDWQEFSNLAQTLIPTVCNVGQKDGIMFGGIFVENVLKLLLVQPAPNSRFFTSLSPNTVRSPALYPSDRQATI